MSSKAASAGSLKHRLCAPPYALLPLLVYALILFCFITHPQSAFRHFALSDPDDWMRLDEVMNWLNGQSWHDLAQQRLSPGDNTVMHWSRLVDLPLAGLALILSPLLGVQQGLMAVSLIVPPALLGLLLAVITLFTRPFLSRAQTAWIAPMLLFAPAILFNFTPGRVDHHAYQLIIAAIGFFCLANLILRPQTPSLACLAALNFACGLWIGGEALPSLIIFTACLSIAAAWQGGALLRQAALFGATLAILTALILPLARPATEWHNAEITWFSAAYVALATSLGATLILQWLLASRCANRHLRLLLLASLAFAAATQFFFWFPAALQGPYANLDHLSAPLILDNVGEAQPLFPNLLPNKFIASSCAVKALLFGRTLFLPLLALVVVMTNMICRRGRSRALWCIAGAYLLPFMLLTLFWQTRCITYLQLFSLMPLAWLLLALWRSIAEKLSGRPRFWAELAAFAVLGLLPVVMLPAIAAGKPVIPDMLLFPGARPSNDCDLSSATIALRNPDDLGAHPHLIMNMMNEGPELLFRTPHSVLSAPYNVGGNRDSFAFFNAREDAPARAILQRRHADLVLLCRHIAPFYAGLSGPGRLLPAPVKGKDGRLELVSDRTHPTLAERLIRNDPPGWLKPITLLDDKDYLLYEVIEP